MTEVTQSPFDIEGVLTELERAEQADDEVRLEVLERVHRSLEHDLDQSSPGR